MISKALRSLTGEATDAKAWDALFRYHNNGRGKGDVGYKPGEKITIKVNFVGFIRTLTRQSRDVRLREMAGLHEHLAAVDRRPAQAAHADRGRQAIGHRHR